MRRPRFRTLPTLRLGGLSVRSYLRSPVPAAALVVLALIPLLYAGLYLWSFWDPFGRLDHLPVALVNEDRPATTDGEELNAGDELTKQLLKRDDLDWHVVDADEAATGLRNGRYYVSLTIPEDFSTNLASPSDTDTADQPAPAMLRARYDDANNYIARELLSAAFREVRAAAGESAVKRYLDDIFLGFNDIHGRTAKAAKGAGQLAGGTDDAKEGSSDLYGGLGEAKEGSSDLYSGLDDAKEGSSDLREGLGVLYGGSKGLAKGSTKASGKVSDAVEKLDPFADAAIPRMKEDAPDIQDDADDVAEAAGTVSKALRKLPDSTEEDAKSAGDVHDRVHDYLDDHPDLETTDPELHSLLSDAEDVSGKAVTLNKFVQANRDQIGTISGRASDVSDLASDVAEDAPDLAEDAEDAQEKVDALNEGLADIAEGNRDLRDGLKEAYSGSKDLDDGIGDLRDGAEDLDGGLDGLHSGAGDLDDGLAELSDGSHDLSGGLHKGARQIPTFDRDDRQDRGGMMSDPVRLGSKVDNEAPDYGTGFAPFFLALSLWVGAMITFMVLPSLSNRALASTAPSWRVALAGWLPAMVVGVLQVLATLGALHFLLGLEAQRWVGLIALLALTAATFTAMVQWLNVRFGAVGRILALALLMLQLTSSGGTYPLETSPEFFRAIAPYLPMTWVVAAVRHLVSGGPLTMVYGAYGVLTLYLMLSLLLTWLAVARRRMWTMTALHPTLTL